MPRELRFKPRVRLADALPEEGTVTRAPRRTRTAIIVSALVFYLCVVGFGVYFVRAPATITAEGQHAGRSATEPAQASLPVETETGSTLGAPPPSVAPTPSRAEHPARSTTNADQVSEEEPPSPPQPLMSCDEAAQEFGSDIVAGSSTLPRDMTGSAYGALLEGPSTLNRLQRCATGRAQRVELCVAIRGFRAIGVTASTASDDRATERCLARAIGELRFSYQPTLQLIRTRITLWPSRRR